MNYGKTIKILIIIAAFIIMIINIFFVSVFPIIINMIADVRRCSAMCGCGEGYRCVA